MMKEYRLHISEVLTPRELAEYRRHRIADAEALVARKRKELAEAEAYLAKLKAN